jgi:hypothetical protein
MAGDVVFFAEFGGAPAMRVSAIHVLDIFYAPVFPGLTPRHAPPQNGIQYSIFDD